MSNYQWPADSFEAQALRDAQQRQADERRRQEKLEIEAQRAREAHFARLMMPVFDQQWPRIRHQHGTQITELQYNDLHFALVEEEDLTQRGGTKASFLSVSAECSTCKQTFERSPVTSRADVGDLLAQLRGHPGCVDPEVVAEAERQQHGQ